MNSLREKQCSWQSFFSIFFQWIFISIAWIVPSSLQAQDSSQEILHEKDHGRWDFWGHTDALEEGLRGERSISVLRSNGSNYILQYRGILDEMDHRLGMVTSSGRPLRSPWWGTLEGEKSEISPENLRRISLVRGMEVIRWGNQGLLAVLVLDEEKPSDQLDFYLWKVFSGSNFYRNPFFRVGGYATDRLSLSASYEYFAHEGMEGRSPSFQADDRTENSKFSLAGSWEMSKEASFYAYLRGFHGQNGSTSPFAFLEGSYQKQILSAGLEGKFQWEKKMEASLQMGWEGEKYDLRQEALYAPLYGSPFSMESGRFRMAGNIKSKEWLPLFWGEESELGVRMEIEEVLHPGLGSQRERGSFFSGHFLQKRRIAPFLLVEGIFGWQGGNLSSSRISSGILAEVDLYEKKQTLQIQAFRHYHSPSFAAFYGRFFNSDGSLALLGNTKNRPEKIYSYSLEYKGDWGDWQSRAGVFYYQIQKNFPQPDSLGVLHFQAFPEVDVWGFDLSWEGKITKEFHLQGNYTFSHLFPSRPSLSRGAPHEGSIGMTYRADSESFFRGWSLGIRLRARDRMELFDFLTQSRNRIPPYLGADIRLSYHYPGLGNYLEFFIHGQDVFTRSHREWTSSPSNHPASPLTEGRFFWAGLRISM